MSDQRLNGLFGILGGAAKRCDNPDVGRPTPPPRELRTPKVVTAADFADGGLSYARGDHNRSD